MMIWSAASVDWGCAVQITAAASIGSGETYVTTNAQTLCVTLLINPFSTNLQTITSGIFVAVLLSHALVCCLATAVIARVQKLYIAINIWCALLRVIDMFFDIR